MQRIRRVVARIVGEPELQPGLPKLSCAVGVCPRQRAVRNTVRHDVLHYGSQRHVTIPTERISGPRTRDPLTLSHVKERIVGVRAIVAEAEKLHDRELRHFGFAAKMQAHRRRSDITLRKQPVTLHLGRVFRTDPDHGAIRLAPESVPMVRDPDTRHDTEPTTGMKEGDRCQLRSAVAAWPNTGAVGAKPRQSIERAIGFVALVGGLALVVEAGGSATRRRGARVDQPVVASSADHAERDARPAGARHVRRVAAAV